MNKTIKIITLKLNNMKVYNIETYEKEKLIENLEKAELIFFNHYGYYPNEWEYLRY